MIEQTDLVLDEWVYIPPTALDSMDRITSHLTLEVMKKMARSKKGLACKFTCRFVNGKDPILLYIAQDSYVIDLEDKIDAIEIRRMIGRAVNFSIPRIKGPKVLKFIQLLLLVLYLNFECGYIVLLHHLAVAMLPSELENRFPV